MTDIDDYWKIILSTFRDSFYKIISETKCAENKLYYLVYSLWKNRVCGKGYIKKALWKSVAKLIGFLFCINRKTSLAANVFSEWEYKKKLEMLFILVIHSWTPTKRFYFSIK